MSSKIRIYQDNKRIATAAFLKTGEVLQVYPTKRKFQTEGDFRTNWKNYVISTLEFRESHPPPKPVKPSKSSKSESKKAGTPKTNLAGWSYNPNIMKLKIDPGTYYIGDLCYALPKDLYDKVFGEIGGYRDGLYRNMEDFFLVGGTAFGDGEYKATDGNTFAVDAGIIGIAPIRTCDMRGGTRISGGHIYSFHEPITCHFGGGDFEFMNTYGDSILSIDTLNGDSDEENDW